MHTYIYTFFLYLHKNKLYFFYCLGGHNSFLSLKKRIRIRTWKIYYQIKFLTRDITLSCSLSTVILFYFSLSFPGVIRYRSKTHEAFNSNFLYVRKCCSVHFPVRSYYTSYIAKNSIYILLTYNT